MGQIGQAEKNAGIATHSVAAFLSVSRVSADPFAGSPSSVSVIDQRWSLIVLKNQMLGRS